MLGMFGKRDLQEKQLLGGLIRANLKITDENIIKWIENKMFFEN